MFISSYNFAMSATRHGFTSLADLYAPAQMKKHFGAILPAYVLMFVFEFLWTTLAGSRYSVGDVLCRIYQRRPERRQSRRLFFCIYWQFLLFAPLLYLLLRRYPTQTLFAALVIDMPMNGSSVPSIFRAISIACCSFAIFHRHLWPVFQSLSQPRASLARWPFSPSPASRISPPSNFTASIGRSPPIAQHQCVRQLLLYRRRRFCLPVS